MIPCVQCSLDVLVKVFLGGSYSGHSFNIDSMWKYWNSSDYKRGCTQSCTMNLYGNEMLTLHNDVWRVRQQIIYKSKDRQHNGQKKKGKKQKIYKTLTNYL